MDVIFNFSSNLVTGANRQKVSGMPKPPCVSVSETNSLLVFNLIGVSNGPSVHQLNGKTFKMSLLNGSSVPQLDPNKLPF